MFGNLKRIGSWLSLGWGHPGLVLDVGSGNSPHPRANVLCDRYLGDTGHRHQDALIRDRAITCGDICALPFKTGGFDFVICRHVLEHLEPEQIPLAISELKRVARAGYVETPSPICEMLMPDPFHKSFVGLSAGILVFTPKGAEVPFQPVTRFLLEWSRTNRAWQRFVRENPELWTTTVHWRDEIPFRVEVPRLYPLTCETTVAELSFIWERASQGSREGARLRRLAKSWLHYVFAVARVVGEPLASSRRESR